MYKRFEKLAGKSEIAAEKTLDRFLKWWFGTLPLAFNNLIRKTDRRINKVSPITGHSRGAVLLGVTAFLIVMLGPTASLLRQFASGSFVAERIIAVLVAAVGTWFLWWAARRWPGNRLHWVQCLVLIPLGLIVFFLPSSYTEASGAPFPHIYALMIVLLMVLTIFARLYGKYVWKTMLSANRQRNLSEASSIDVDEESVIKRYAKTLADLIHDPKLNLMVEVQDPPRYSRPNAVQTLFSAPARKPLLLVFLPCLFAIMIPNVDVARAVAIIVFFVCWAIFSWGLYYRRWDLLIGILNRWFMRGGPMLLSLVVIVLGVGQLLNVQYITTVLQGGPVMSLVLSAYLVLWLFEYWVNRFVYENLLTVFKSTYPHAPDPTWAITLDQTATERAEKMSILGGSRFLLQDTRRNLNDQFRIYMPYRLLDRLALGLPGERGKQARDAVNEAKNRLRAYFTLLNIVLAAMALTFVLYEVAWKQPRAMVTMEAVSATASESQRDPSESSVLVGRLREIAASDNKKAILLAASGGGTRAALYTASVLCGLHQIGAGNNIALLSSVSGGSAAAAYYAIHGDELEGPCDTSGLAIAEAGAWPTFYRVMGASFINDVLRGVVERRIIGPEQNGVLLAESFQRHFSTESNAATALTIGQVDDFGLIFNTTLTGHPYRESEELTAIYDNDTGNRCVANEYTIHAGGRLVITNLSPKDFPERGPDYARDAFLKYSVIDSGFTATINDTRYDSMPLFAAAAISANFPPVFSDAGLQINRIDNDETCVDRYWVTDGGATDNRGILSLLYALKAALEDMRDPLSLPELHIVVAEASAESIDYNQIRGVGGKMGASAQIASQLKMRLIGDINRLVCTLKQEPCEQGKSAWVHVHYLEMPVIFRTRGGLGTHWKLPWRVTFRDPGAIDKEAANKKTVWAADALELMATLHGRKDCDERILDQDLRQWICDADPHRAVWSALVEGMKSETNTDL